MNNYNQFYPHLYDLSDLQEYEFGIFFRDGTFYHENLASFNSGFFNLYGGDYASNKHQFDEFIYRLNYRDFGFSETHGSMYGYCYWDYDGDINLCVVGGSVSYFCVNTINSDVHYINGYRIDEQNQVIGYLGQRDSTQQLFTYNSSTHLYEVDFTYDYIHDINFAYNSINNYNGLLFDYQLSNGNNVVTLEGISYTAYSSYFTLDNDSQISLQFGLYQGEEYNKFQEGYELGSKSGWQSGYTQGLREGYADGLLQNGNASVGFLSMVGGAVAQFTPVLNIEVLPNITLGTCISIPVICTVLVAIFKIARG